MGDSHFPTGAQAVPSQDPSWDPNDPLRTWYLSHFQACVLEGLKRSKFQPLNYTRLSAVTQPREENPTAFLEGLREALIKYTAISPYSPEAEIILKDKSVIQSAPDNWKKLQKSAVGPQGGLRRALRSC